MAGLTQSMMLSDKVAAKHVVARLLAQVPMDVENENIEVWIYIDGQGVPGLEVVSVEVSYPIVFKQSTLENPVGKILLAYDQQTLGIDLGEKLFFEQ